VKLEFLMLKGGGMMLVELPVFSGLHSHLSRIASSETRDSKQPCKRLRCLARSLVLGIKIDAL